MMIAICIIISLVFFILLVGRVNLHLKFSRQVEALFAQSQRISQKSYHPSQAASLPEPVQRYFNYVLKEGQPYISFAGIKHAGQFKANLDKGWMNIKGEQYAATEMPGFIWKGTTTMFVARDMYIAKKGRLIVTLLSVFNIVDAKGSIQYDTGELLRWLGESVLYPTNLLPTEHLCWFPID
jgi:hypothetical protein